MKIKWHKSISSNTWRQILFRAMTLVAPPIAACSVTGFASLFDLCLVGWFTMAVTSGIALSFELRQLPAPAKIEMGQKGQIAMLFWLVGAGAIAPIFLEAYLVFDKNQDPLSALAVVIGGFLLLASALTILYFYRRR